MAGANPLAEMMRSMQAAPAAGTKEEKPAEMTEQRLIKVAADATVALTALTSGGTGKSPAVRQGFRHFTQLEEVAKQLKYPSLSADAKQIILRNNLELARKVESEVTLLQTAKKNNQKLVEVALKPYQDEATRVTEQNTRQVTVMPGDDNALRIAGLRTQMDSVQARKLINAANQVNDFLALLIISFIIQSQIEKYSPDRIMQQEVQNYVRAENLRLTTEGSSERYRMTAEPNGDISVFILNADGTHRPFSAAERSDFASGVNSQLSIRLNGNADAVRDHAAQQFCNHLNLREKRSKSSLQFSIDKDKAGKPVLTCNNISDPDVPKPVPIKESDLKAFTAHLKQAEADRTVEQSTEGKRWLLNLGVEMGESATASASLPAAPDPSAPPADPASPGRTLSGAEPSSAPEEDSPTPVS